MTLKLEINRGFKQYKVYDLTPESPAENHCYTVTCTKRTVLSDAYKHDNTITSIYAKTAEGAVKIFKEKAKGL